MSLADKVNLDIFLLKNDTLDDPGLPRPEEVAAEIVEKSGDDAGKV